MRTVAEAQVEFSDAADLVVGTTERPRATTALLRNSATAYTRATGFYFRSWGKYLTDDRTGAIPVVRPTTGLGQQAFRDEIVLAGMRTFRPVSDERTYARMEREIDAALELYADRGWLENPASFYGTPPPLARVDIRRGGSGQRRHDRVTFPSEYEPHPDEPGRQRWLAYTANRRAHAWMIRHREQRPWLVCIHGAGMGRSALDLVLFRARALHQQFGLNIAVLVLPLHGPRGQGLPKGAGFPGENMLDTVHGAAQAVWDTRRLISWIRAEDGDPPVGLTSISLGGCISGLVASLEDGIDAAILGVPVADLGELFQRHSGFPHNDSRMRTMQLARRLSPVASPLALTPRVPLEGRFIYAGLADRLVHPRHQVARLWEHWERPQIAWYEGGHTGFFRSKTVQRFVADALQRSGLTHPSPWATRAH